MTDLAMFFRSLMYLGLGLAVVAAGILLVGMVALLISLCDRSVDQPGAHR